METKILRGEHSFRSRVREWGDEIGRGRRSPPGLAVLGIVRDTGYGCSLPLGGKKPSLPDPALPDSFGFGPEPRG